MNIIMRMIKKNITKPKTLIKDILFCGSNGGKYNEKYFFIVSTDEGILIMDRTNMKVMDHYEHSIQSINYMGMDIRNFNKISNDNSNYDLIETMNMLPK